ncbi:MAG TPA: hypothetical protein VHQ65_05985 [Thermoanaerobaculia bacterium]|nr:hypothetical protein [Thermoanaerobaculia bacterium]
MSPTTTPPPAARPRPVLREPADLPLGALLAAVLLLALVLPATGCRRPAPEEIEVSKQELQQVLEQYADRLSSAYALGDATLLEPVASQREMASVANNIRQLADQGYRLATDQKEVTIEELSMPDRTSAYVRTFEIWDIQTAPLGSEQMLNRDPNQRSRVRYQLELEDGQWRVLWRQRMDESGGAGAAAEGAAGGGGS